MIIVFLGLGYLTQNDVQVLFSCVYLVMHASELCQVRILLHRSGNILRDYVSSVHAAEGLCS